MAATLDLARIEFDELTKTYLAHDKDCPCALCSEMDRRLDEMCVRPYCREFSATGRWTCEVHAAEHGLPVGWEPRQANVSGDLHHLIHIECRFRSIVPFDLAEDQGNIRRLINRHICASEEG